MAAVAGGGDGNNAPLENIGRQRPTPSPLQIKHQRVEHDAELNEQLYQQIFESFYDDQNKDTSIKDKNQEKVPGFDYQACLAEENNAFRQLTQEIMSTRDPLDVVSTSIMENINVALAATDLGATDNEVDDDDDDDSPESTSSISSNHRILPINQSGLVSQHDRPYATYGHFGTYMSVHERERFSLLIIHTHTHIYIYIYISRCENNCD